MKASCIILFSWAHWLDLEGSSFTSVSIAATLAGRWAETEASAIHLYCETIIEGPVPVTQTLQAGPSSSASRLGRVCHRPHNQLCSSHFG